MPEFEELAAGLRAWVHDPGHGYDSVTGHVTLDAISGPWTKDDLEFIAHARTDIPLLLAAVGAVLKLAAEARPALSFPPADCTNACGYGPCECSGNFRAGAWDLDPEAVRSAVLSALTGKENGR